jgi:geranylgeranyl diphosphate synthase type II
LKDEIETELKKAFPETNEVSKAVNYALFSGGKRIRPILVQLIGEAIGKNFPVMEASLSIEFFHTASLIADDLPCMDNDNLRRGKNSLHKEFGETIALLASYALISEAFKKIEENGKKMALFAPGLNEKANEAVAIALGQASHSAGIKGAVLGQYFDLYEKENNLTQEKCEEVIYLKTGTLFEGAFVLGWVFGGGEVSYLPTVKDFATEFGVIFQIRDDLKDIKEDKKNKGFNFALRFGREKAKERIEKAFRNSEKLLSALPINKEKLLFILKELVHSS